jgi:uncharacterized protein
MADKLVTMRRHGPEDRERTAIPFVIATAAQPREVKVVMGFQANGVTLATKGTADRGAAPSFPPLTDPVAAYMEARGKLLVCWPSVQSRKIDPKGDLVQGASVANAAAFVKERAEATNVPVY